jgi:hypothetical protein
MDGIEDAKRRLESKYERLRACGNRREERMREVRIAIDVILSGYKRLAEISPELRTEFDLLAYALVRRYRAK